MKKLILALFLIIISISLKAQTNYYPNETGIVAGNGYTYKYNRTLSPGFITLYNSENRFTGVKWGMKDGSPIPEDLGLGRTSQFIKDTWTRQKSFSIVQNAMYTLPTADRERLKGKNLLIMMRIDTSTGKVIEIEFIFLENGPFRYVPVEIFRKIETDLKSQIWFIMTTEGKKLNYGGLGWTQTIK